ncbi:MAG: FAD:protein FMN transferase, partial [Oligosphaeraceae bacterium]|nr:FAD:protein FMN transferase [Oligosphaeraceae bacterium]
MQRYNITAIFLGLLLLPGFLIRPRYERNYQVAVFNTIGEIHLWGRNEQGCQDSARKVIAAWQKLHRTLNRFAPDSELSALNRTAPGEPFRCSESLWKILQNARELHTLTDGAFDVSISPLMRLWGFKQPNPQLPQEQDIAQALQLVGLNKLHFDDQERTVSFPLAGMALDFGGLAKGYALDQAREILEQDGQDCYMLNLGGNIYCSEKLPPGRKQPFQIGIRDPQDAGRILKVLTLRGQFVSTSANYERGIRVGEKKIG